MLRAAGGPVTGAPLRASSLRNRCYLGSLVSFLCGSALSLYLYLHADDSIEGRIVEELHNTKAFRHDLEVYGGKMSLLGSQMNDWFVGLWQGRQLAVTVGCICGVVALALFLMGRCISDEPPSSGDGKEMS